MLTRSWRLAVSVMGRLRFSDVRKSLIKKETVLRVATRFRKSSAAESRRGEPVDGRSLGQGYERRRAGAIAVTVISSSPDPIDGMESLLDSREA